MGRAEPGTLEHILGEECFLCGSAIAIPAQRMTFSKAGTMAPELPCHADCLIVRGPVAAARIYHQRVADLANVPRVHPVQRMFRRLLLGER
jgi:hypothetical protein